MEEDTKIPLIATVQSLQSTKTKKLGVPLTAIFIVGTLCGSGILAIPQAIVDGGWIGIPVLAICGIASAFTGTVLGNCWTILRNRYPEYDEQRVTDPYPTIGYRAAGKIGEYATRVCIDISLFGGATVFALLIAGNLSDLIKSLGHGEFSLCYLLLVVVGCLTPVTWLGTPKDFWQAGVIACVTTSIGALLILVGVIKDASKHEGAHYPNPSMRSFFNAFGTILYSFGGASCFPTIQVDMKQPNKFSTAVIFGLGAVLCMYLLAGVSGFIVFGDQMKPNVLSALSPGWVSYTINILITAHLLMAFVIVTNPVMQEIEGFLKIPDKFTLRRLIVRTMFSCSVLFVALSIPHFNIILSLIGGSTVTCTNFIFPPLFYLLLSRQNHPIDAHGPPPAVKSSDDVVDAHHDNADVTNWMRVNLRLHVKVILIEIIAIGVVGGISSTYFAFASLVNGESGFTVPCYVNASVGL